VTALVVFFALLFWAGVFSVYFTARGTSPLDLFLGPYEPPPSDLGLWRELGPDGAGRLREERWLLPDGRAGAGYFLHQVRHRDALTRDIVSVEPEARVRRRRVGARAS
jgi:hypothetical protein